MRRAGHPVRAWSRARGPAHRRAGRAVWRVTLVLAGGMALAGWFMACAPIPPPDSLVELDRVRQAPGAREAARYAPPAYDHAEQLRRQARVAFDEGRLGAARILAERANAAYAHAVALARLARAEEARVAAEAEAVQAERELTEIDAEHQRVAADIEALELRLKVLRNAEPIVPSRTAKGARELARREAVAALRLQARLLCTAARLLAQPTSSDSAAGASGSTGVAAEQLSSAEQQLAAFEQLVAEGPAAAPIDQAMRVRAGCLRALTASRRAAGRAAGAVHSADALLARLSELGHGSPLRDDRGVVVTLRNVFTADKLNAAGQSALADLAEVARQHPAFPLLVVLHQARAASGQQQEQWQRRASAVQRALGRDRAAVELAGTAQPVVDPRGKYAARNERVEIVFVAPAGP